MKWIQSLLVASAMVAFGVTGASADLLTIDAGVSDAYGANTPVSGSWFNLGGNVFIGPGTDGGIIENTAQSPGQVDAPWLFSGNMGNIWSQTTGIDRNSFANIRVAWGAAPNIPMGTTAAVTTPAHPFYAGRSIDFDSNGSVTGLEFMNLGDIDTDGNDEYVLNYGAVVTGPGAPTAFVGALWFLHLEGDIVPAAAVPEPMSMALVGSSLIGLVGLRRKFMA